MAAVLDGLHVLDLSQGPAGGAASMVLADFGAQVLKIERPGGDLFRHLAAAPMWLRGKSVLALDLNVPADVARLHDLVPSADVLLVSMRPGSAERLRVDYETISALNPRLVYCSITGFGMEGPYRRYKGYEGLVAAKSGRMMTFAGQIPRPGPVYAAVQVGTHVAAQSAVHGILAALFARQQIGRGQRVDTSLLQGMLPYDLTGLFLQQLSRRFPTDFAVDPSLALLQTPTLQYQPVLTRDGRWMQLANLMEHLFHSYIAAVDLTEIYADPRFDGAPALLAEDAKDEMRSLMLGRMRERTDDQWMDLFVDNGNVASEPIVSTQEALHHPQARYIGLVLDGEHPEHGTMRQIGPLATLMRTPACPVISPAGGAEPIETFKRSDIPLPASGTGSNGHRLDHPLEGVTIVEFAAIIAVPYACSILADLGARVIKVEPPEGDGLRGMGKAGVSTIKTTAGKESICVDLKTEAGREIARRLIEQADILIHNFRPGVTERLGIGYEDVRQYNPNIVYVSCTGYGEDGPYAHRPSAHPTAGAAMGGVLWQAGAAMPPADVETIDDSDIKEYARRFYRANELNPDPNTSMIVVSAALLGLYAQRTQGVGQHIQTNMLLGNAYANLDDFLSYPGKPPRPLVDAELYGLNALYRLYSASDGWVFLACVTETEWQSLCHALDRSDLLDDERFRTAESRYAHDQELSKTLTEILAARPADEWEETLTRRDVGCVRADRAGAGAFWDRDPHVRANGFVREVEHLRWGPQWRHGPLVSFTETPERIGAGVLAGQHTNQIMRELGYSMDDVHTLRASGIIASEEP